MKHNYHAKRTTCAAGHPRPSRAEAKRCADLHLLQRAGVISDLEFEPQYWFAVNGVQLKHENGRRIGYKPDFRYRENGRIVVEDVKGVSVRDWPLRRAVFLALFPDVDFREIRK